LNCRYTLRNAEYRLCLERNLDIHEEDSKKQAQGNSKNNLQGLVLESEETNQSLGKDTEFEKIAEDLSDDINIQGLGEISLEAQQYILHLQSHLSSVKKVCNSNLETPLEHRQVRVYFLVSFGMIINDKNILPNGAVGSLVEEYDYLDVL